MCKRLIEYFLRDKVDLIVLILMGGMITTWFFYKDELILLACSVFSFIWASGAIIRMGIYSIDETDRMEKGSSDSQSNNVR